MKLRVWCPGRSLPVLFLLLAAVPLQATRILGEIRYENFPPTLSGFGPSEFRPAADLEIELVDFDRNVRVATALTNSLGRFDLEVSAAPQGTRIAVNIFARNQAVRVVDNLRQIYGWSADAQTVNADPFNFGLLQITEMDNAGAVNILAVITAGNRYVNERASRPIPLLQVRWKKAITPPCGTSCYSGGEMYVLNRGSSRFDDTDEYDDSVLMHEYGHHMQETVSCSESPGGPHGRCEPDQDLRLAWSEGSAQYFSVVAGELDPAVDQFPATYLDTVGNRAAGSDLLIEDNLEDNATCPTANYGTQNEDTTARILWDLQDARPDGPDNFTMSERDVFAVIDGMRGSLSCDLTTFATGLCSRSGSLAAGFIPIFRGFNVEPPCSAPPTNRRRAVRR